MMMRNILLPEKIGTRRLFNQRVLSIMMQDDYVRGSVVLVKSKSSVVEKLIEIPLVEGTSEDLVHSPEETLIGLVAAAGKVDEIRVVIPTAMTIVKELEVPFTDTEKIRMVIEYEIESLLPFSLEEAIVDFVVTKSNKELQSSQILAVAIRKQDLAGILQPFEQSNIKVRTILVDLFATYGLYQKISIYRDLPGSTALVDIGQQGTRITFLQGGQLKLTRYIAKGLNFILSHISEETGMDKNTVWTHLQSVGAKQLDTQDPLEKTVQTNLMNFLNEVQFTLNSFSLKLNYYEGISKILFTGKATTIPNLMEFSTEFLQIPSELFDPKKIFDDRSIKNHAQLPPQEWGSFINTLGATLGPIEFEGFNLRRKEFALLDVDLGLRQILVGCVLLFFSLGTIGFVGYSQVADLHNVARSLELDQIARLKALLPRKDQKQSPKLPAVLKKAEELLKEKTALWSPFGQERIKPLEILLEVTQTFDKNQFKLDVDEFILTEKEAGNPIIELEGFFKSDKGLGYHHAEWEQLVDHIKESPLLTFVEPPSTIPAAEKGLKFSVKLQKKGRPDNQATGQS
jgi:type IV pilus assembly protein PilM